MGSAANPRGFSGKTSLTSALAGAFGLSIYNLSLLDPSGSENKLSSLFAALPTRCVLLLEDVDAAGLSRNHDPATSRSNISLSGLLNAIDGVSSPEGRILIMTTNNPEVLDSALIRPGRVDMRINFALPTRVEIEQLFLSMYSSPSSRQDDSSAGAPGSHEDEKAGGEQPLEDMARQYAAALPEGQFSIAAIQGFLLKHKRKPLLAVRDAEGCKSVDEV